MLLKFISKRAAKAYIKNHGKGSRHGKTVQLPNIGGVVSVSTSNAFKAQDCVDRVQEYCYTVRRASGVVS